MAGLPRILLVEDNPNITEIYSSILTDHGFALETAVTIDELLEKAPQFKPDVILLDIMLPGGKSGLDALPILRNQPEYGCAECTILMLTNLGENDELKEQWERYADGYVIKAEINPSDLIGIINSLDASEPAGE